MASTFASSMIAASHLISVVEAVAVAGDPDGKRVRHLLLDSRILAAPADACFFAIKGPRHDGHLHIDDLYAKGVRVFVVHQMPLFLHEDSLYVQVSDVVRALQDLATWNRMQFDFPVIGITGSNGKTTVKEWLAQLAAPLTPIVKSPRSYNSQVGVPLSVWQMQEFHRLAIIEAGISTTGEMERLQKIIRPTIGIFTNLGSAHDAGFTSLKEKFEEKWKLFRKADTVVYHDNKGDLVNLIRLSSSLGQRLVGWQITDVTEIGGINGYGVKFAVEDEHYETHLPFGDASSVENALHAAVTLLILGFEKQVILNNLLSLRTLGMRLEWKEGIAGSSLLDDTYNNDLDGLITAIQQLGQYGQGNQGRVLILSDLPQTGLAEVNVYSRAAEAISTGHFEQIWTVGPAWQTHASLLPDTARFVLDTEELLNRFDTSRVAGKLILLKGGRSFGFERIVQRLQKFSHGTRLEVDLNAVIANLNYYRARLPQGHKIMAMVKAGAYGAGSYEIASTLAYQKVDYLAVAYVDEGAELRNHNVRLPIMVMNAVEEQFDTCYQYNLEPVIYSLPMMRAWLQSLGHRSTQIHLELNTGMNRLGFDETDMDELCSLLRSESIHLNGLRIASVFSHLAAADDPAQDDFSALQLNRYHSMAARIGAVWGKPFIRHVANTSGAARLPETALDMVRLGIGLYGVEMAGESGLKPVGRLKSVVTQIRAVPAGESVSYGHKWVFDEPKRIATVAIGYADGLSRKMGNGAFAMRIRGGLAPTVGNVCMDMTMVDVTHMPEVREFDEAVIFDETNRVEDLAHIEGTIPYEILTRISERVRRIYVSQ